MVKRNSHLFRIGVFISIIWLAFSALYITSIVHAEDPVPSTPVIAIETLPSVSPTIFFDPTSTFTPPFPTSTAVPTNTQGVTQPPDLLGTVSALQIVLAESATNSENDRINVQPTLSSLEKSVSELVKQQGSLLRMQLVGFCITGITILALFIYSMANSRKNTSGQKRINLSDSSSSTENQDMNKNSRELANRLDATEQDAKQAKEVAQDAQSQLRTLETKILEHDRAIYSQSQLSQAGKPSLLQHQNKNMDVRELERRLRTAEQEATRASKVSQEARSQIITLEEKIREQDRVISALRRSKEFEQQQKKLDVSIKDVLQNHSKIITAPKDDLVTNVLWVYNELAKQEGEEFIPLDKFVAKSIDSKLAKTESDVYKILEYILQKRPGAISIENIRGKTGKHIAVFKEYL